MDDVQHNIGINKLPVVTVVTGDLSRHQRVAFQSSSNL